MVYSSILSIKETEDAIKYLRDSFQRIIEEDMAFKRVSAPLYVLKSSGLNDDLNGTERPVSFDIKGIDDVVEIVHSLAKWKRYALHNYDFKTYEGIYTNMNAIRRDEVLDKVHSSYVDQWDWEMVIDKSDRNIDYLKEIVKRLYSVIYKTNECIKAKYPKLNVELSKDIHFITSQELLDLYPDLNTHERENEICKKYGSVFVIGIGNKLSNGLPHDGRAPDYDDWYLNGDILVYHKGIGEALELSSMGIRVDENSIVKQCEISNSKDRLNLPYHKMVINKELPYTIGGGIGQSRLCMLLLDKVHIGEVQASVWPKEMIEDLKKQNIKLL